MFALAPQSAVYLIAFLIPLLAGSRRQLRIFALAAFVPAVFFALMATFADLTLGYFGVVGFALAAIMGAVARWISLFARHLQHPRPWSFWIEVLFGLAAVWIILIAKV